MYVSTQKKKNCSVLSNLFHKLLIGIGSRYLHVVIWTDKIQGLSGLWQVNFNFLEEPGKRRLCLYRGGGISSLGSKPTVLGGWCFRLTLEWSYGLARMVVGQLVGMAGWGCDDPEQSQKGKGKRQRQWISSFLLPWSCPSKVGAEKVWRRNILQNKSLKIFLFKVSVVYDWLTIHFGDFDEFCYNNFYAFWAEKRGEIKKMETLCQYMLVFTIRILCHELTRRSQKHHAKKSVTYIFFN